MIQKEGGRAESMCPSVRPQTLPPRPQDGLSERLKRWSENHWRAAWRRAEGESWGSIAAVLGVRETTARKYVLLEGFDELIDWARGERLARQRNDWLVEEEELTLEGVRAVHRTLIDLMKGKKLAGERRPPAAYIRLRAAETYARIVAYEDVAKVIALAHARQALRDSGLFEDDADDAGGDAGDAGLEVYNGLHPEAIAAHEDEQPDEGDTEDT